MSPLTRRLLIAGFLPLPWFLLVIGFGGLFAPGYSAISQHASELGLVSGVPQLCEQIATLGSGVALIAFGAGLWRASAWPVAFGGAAWIVFGASMLSNGIWMMGSPMHGLYGIGIVNLIAPALALAECERLRRDRVAYAITVIASLASILYLWLNLTGNNVAAYHGLSQRVFASINSAWPAFVAWRLLRDDHAPEPAR